MTAPKILAFLAASALTGASFSAKADNGATVPYNEAVRIINGKRVVEMEPVPDFIRNAKHVDKPKPGDIRIGIETKNGLMDCTVGWYHPNFCVPSTYGVEKDRRMWAVKMNGQWHNCIGAVKAVKCVPSIGDGVLRPLGSLLE